MAVKRTRHIKNELPAPAEITTNEEEAVVPKKKKTPKLLIGVVLCVLALVAFWYKTNSWPIVALVGMRPITRFEVDQAMYKANGKTQVDDIVTELLIKTELKKNKINITNNDIDSKITEIRTSLGTTTKLEDVLAQRGMTMADFRNYLAVQMGIEKLLAGKINVTDNEINTYITQNKAYLTSTTDDGKKAEALNAIRVSKLQTEVDNWVTQLKAKNKVWKAPGL